MIRSCTSRYRHLSDLARRHKETTGIRILKIWGAHGTKGPALALTLLARRLHRPVITYQIKITTQWIVINYSVQMTKRLLSLIIIRLLQNSRELIIEEMEW